MEVLVEGVTTLSVQGPVSPTLLSMPDEILVKIVHAFFRAKGGEPFEVQLCELNSGLSRTGGYTFGYTFTISSGKLSTIFLVCQRLSSIASSEIWKCFSGHLILDTKFDRLNYTPAMKDAILQVIPHVTTLFLPQITSYRSLTAGTSVFRFSNLQIIDFGTMYDSPRRYHTPMRQHFSLVEALQGTRDQDIADVLTLSVIETLMAKGLRRLFEVTLPTIKVDVALYVPYQWFRYERYDIPADLLVRLPEYTTCVR